MMQSGGEMKTTLAFALSALAVAGCGDSKIDCSKVNLSIPPSQMIVGLSTDQRKELCDFSACQVGGYGATLTCSTGPAVTVAGSQAKCVSQLPTNQACHATVADVMECFAAIDANPCISTALGPDCEAVFVPECLVITPLATSFGVVAE